MAAGPVSPREVKNQASTDASSVQAIDPRAGPAAAAFLVSGDSVDGGSGSVVHGSLGDAVTGHGTELVTGGSRDAEVEKGSAGQTLIPAEWLQLLAAVS